MRGHNHCGHRNTAGMDVKWTKKPAYVIWYNAVRAERRIAIPPLWKSVARRKFYR